jgi:hypothetical protein
MKKLVLCGIVTASVFEGLAGALVGVYWGASQTAGMAPDGGSSR